MSASSRRSSGPSSEMRRRLKELLAVKENERCADCPAHRPRWVSFLMSPADKEERIMAVLCCEDCAQHHWWELGKKRCMIKALKMTHEWTTEDIKILEASGNGFVNAMFEANLSEEDFDKVLVLKDEEKESRRRSKFIKNKYRRHLYSDDILFHQMMIDLLKTKKKKQQATGGKRRSEKERQDASTRESPDRAPPVKALSKNESPQSIRDFAAIMEEDRRTAKNRTSKHNDSTGTMEDESLQLDTLFQWSESMQFISSGSQRENRMPQRSPRFNRKNIEGLLEGSDSSNSTKISDCSSNSSGGSVSSFEGRRRKQAIRKTQSLKPVVEEAGRSKSPTKSNSIDTEIAKIAKIGNDKNTNLLKTGPSGKHAFMRPELRKQDSVPRRTKQRRRSSCSNLLVPAELGTLQLPERRGGMGRRRSVSNPNLLAMDDEGQPTEAQPTLRRDVRRRRLSLTSATDRSCHDIPALQPPQEKAESRITMYRQAIAQVSSRNLSGPTTEEKATAASVRSLLEVAQNMSARRIGGIQDSTNSVPAVPKPEEGSLRKEFATHPAALPLSILNIETTRNQNLSSRGSNKASASGCLKDVIDSSSATEKSPGRSPSITSSDNSVNSASCNDTADIANTRSASPSKDVRTRRNVSRNKFKAGRSLPPKPGKFRTETIPSTAELGYEDSDVVKEYRKLRRRKERLMDLKARTPPIRGNSSDYEVEA